MKVPKYVGTLTRMSMGLIQIARRNGAGARAMRAFVFQAKGPKNGSRVRFLLKIVKFIAQMGQFVGEGHQNLPLCKDCMPTSCPCTTP